MKLIILDRDGVINYDSNNYIKSPEEWQAIPSSLTALAMLKQAGYSVAVATNQSGIGRGYYTEEMLNEIHEKMKQTIRQAGGEIIGIYHCPHHPDIDCHCRKPNPGLLKKISADLNCDLTDCIFIGDRLSDIKAAKKMKMKPMMVRSGITEEHLSDDPILNGVDISHDLLEAVTKIINASKTQ